MKIHLAVWSHDKPPVLVSACGLTKRRPDNFVQGKTQFLAYQGPSTDYCQSCLSWFFLHRQDERIESSEMIV